MSNHERSTPSFMREFIPSGINLPSVEEILEYPGILDAKLVLIALRQARDLITKTPGPNLEKRRFLAPYWFDFWEDILLKYQPTQNQFDHFHTLPSRLVRIEHLPGVLERIVPHKQVGIISGAGFEGHLAHRSSIDYIARHTFPVMLLEPDENFTLFNKSRILPFLPLSIRLWMWSIYPNTGLVSTVPRMSADEATDMNSFYQNLIDKLNVGGIVRCFAHEQDPHVLIKVNRAHYHPNNIIRNSTLSTSAMVGRLTTLSEEEMHTSDMTEYAMPRVIHDEDTLDFWLERTKISFYDTLWNE